MSIRIPIRGRSIGFTDRLRSHLGARLGALLIALSALAASSCGKEEPLERITSDARFRGWAFYDYETVRILRPPSHPVEKQIPEMAYIYARGIKEISRMLGMEPPTDTLIVVFYSGYGQGEEWTGKENSYYEDRVIHFWLPSFVGPTLVDFVVTYYQKDPPAFPFLKHGLRALFDYSGQDYHGITTGFPARNMFIPLGDLAVDANINSDTERHQTAEAASFVAFILANYGPGRLSSLWTSKLPFDKTVSDLFLKPVDALEQEWLAFADTARRPTVDSTATEAPDTAQNQDTTTGR